MPVAKGAGYVLSSISKKKKGKSVVGETTAVDETTAYNNRDLVSVSGREAALQEVQKLHEREQRRQARGCRHCRRNHDVRIHPIECKINMCVKCIGCEKTLVINTDAPPASETGSSRLIIRSCCADYRGKLSKSLVKGSLPNRKTILSRQHGYCDDVALKASY
ncbi:unnamed protein product [Clavelina lepadiformis]|uniref:Recombination activating protein 1 n=1 Tax=Clavelina lepadiformis TaxID=159417 RepID=A0ABP0GH28_CLALP